MRVLDIDLDFFLNDVAFDRCQGSGRLSNDYQPWSEQEVRRFLEEKCGLSTMRKTHGTTVRTHDEAFYVWKDWIEKGRLSSPFHLTHVDAHLDTGGGSDLDGNMYILKELLDYPVEQRPDHIRYMNEGNYIAFVLACQWVSEIEFVIHPRGNDEVARLLTKNWDRSTGIFQLGKVSKTATKGTVYDFEINQPEEEVPFKVMEEDNFFFSGDPYSFLLLCHSEDFTPASSDSLIAIIEEYMIKI